MRTKLDKNRHTFANRHTSLSFFLPRTCTPFSDSAYLLEDLDPPLLALPILALLRPLLLLFALIGFSSSLDDKALLDSPPAPTRAYAFRFGLAREFVIG